jgi:DNA uptake protein ComE-like DNA-binding protein
MTLLTESIDIDAIASNLPRSHFSESEIAQLADSILKSGGIINPLILRQKMVMSYEVVEGHLEYYAAVKANQIDSDFESIRAFVVTPQNQIAICEQVKLLRTAIASPISPPTEIPASIPTKDSINLQKLEAQVQRLEQRLNADFGGLNQKIDALYDAIAGFIANSTKIIPEPVAPAVKTQKTSAKKEPSPTKSIKLKAANEPNLEETPVLNQINTLELRELALKLDRAGARANIRNNIFVERDKSPFTSLHDLQQRVDGLGEKTLKKIVEKWA